MLEFHGEGGERTLVSFCVCVMAGRKVGTYTCGLQDFRKAGKVIYAGIEDRDARGQKRIGGAERVNARSEGIGHDGDFAIEIFAPYKSGLFLLHLFRKLVRWVNRYQMKRYGHKRDKRGCVVKRLHSAVEWLLYFVLPLEIYFNEPRNLHQVSFPADNHLTLKTRLTWPSHS